MSQEFDEEKRTVKQKIIENSSLVSTFLVDTSDINGFKKPSKEREQQILDRIHELGKIYLEVAFAS